MKYQIVAALLGLSQGVQINAGMKAREVNKMHEICKSVHGIEYPHQSVLLQLDESPLPSADPKEEATPAAQAETVNEGSNQEGSSLPTPTP